MWLVELAPLADGALVAATTARALGFAPTAERSSAPKGWRVRWRRSGCSSCSTTASI
ncbi:MAG: hypothetical protein IPI51_15705 [Betaproteobacteria bacterium]|nr:hypothetical protein [Betaproteobacteria bacterium]